MTKSTKDSLSKIPSIAGSPAILIVDDDALMREVCSIIVEESGGRALVAASGEEALQLASRDPHDLAAAVIDFSMPGMDGRACTAALRRLRPALPVVLISGLKISAEVSALVQSGDVSFLAKPFREQELVESILKALNG
jgi:CheY-like chemotaxis protein